MRMVQTSIWNYAWLGYFFYVLLLEMNLLIDSVYEEVRTLRKEVEELKALVKTGVFSYYYVIHYDLEYFEPIDLLKLLEDMHSYIPWEEVYVNIKQESDKTFENPTLGIYKYHIHITFYAKLTTRCSIDTIDKYFQTKLGTTTIDYYTSLSEFYTQLQQKKMSVQEHYKMVHQKILAISPISWDSLK